MFIEDLVQYKTTNLFDSSFLKVKPTFSKLAKSVERMCTLITALTQAVLRVGSWSLKH